MDTKKMTEKEVNDIIDAKLAAFQKKLESFRYWRKFDSVTDKMSPITGNSGQIGFFGSSKAPQPTTSGSSSSLVANSGTALNSASTYDGYTLGQVVKALRTLGLLQ